MAAAGATAPETGAKWIWDWKTGYRRVTPGIISGPEVKKVPLPTGGELWGPYKKVYADGFFGRNFIPPSTVDGIPILCQCRDIHNYMRTEGSSGGLSLGAGGPFYLVVSLLPAGTMIPKIFYDLTQERHFTWK